MSVTDLGTAPGAPSPVAPSPVATAAAALADEQWRVAGLLAAAGRCGRWDARLRHEERWSLVHRGHFGDHVDELDWTPREVAGHLRDSAAVFTERLRRLRAEADPLLPDFVPGEPARVAGYAAVPLEQLLAELRENQAELLRTVADLAPDELARAGRHEVDGPVTVADLLAFLPAHQGDHADQLARLVGR